MWQEFAMWAIVRVLWYFIWCFKNFLALFCHFYLCNFFKENNGANGLLSFAIHVFYTFLYFFCWYFCFMVLMLLCILYIFAFYAISLPTPFRHEFVFFMFCWLLQIIANFMLIWTLLSFYFFYPFTIIILFELHISIKS